MEVSRGSVARLEEAQVKRSFGNAPAVPVGTSAEAPPKDRIVGPTRHPATIEGPSATWGIHVGRAGCFVFMSLPHCAASRIKHQVAVQGEGLRDGAGQQDFVNLAANVAYLGYLRADNAPCR